MLCNAMELNQQCIGMKLLMISIVVQYEAMHWSEIAYDKHTCAMQ